MTYSSSCHHHLHYLQLQQSPEWRHSDTQVGQVYLEKWRLKLRKNVFGVTLGIQTNKGTGEKETERGSGGGEEGR